METLIKRVQTIKGMFRDETCGECGAEMGKDDAGSKCNKCWECDHDFQTKYTVVDGNPTNIHYSCLEYCIKCNHPNYKISTK